MLVFPLCKIQQIYCFISRGFTQFQLGDRVTMVGPQEKLEEVVLRFDA
jgi:hypothetical protein